MEGRRAEQVRAAVEALSARDLDAFFGVVEEDFVVDWSASTAPYAGTYRGREEIQGTFDPISDWDEYRLEILRLRETDGGDIVSELRAVARGGVSGVEVSGTGGLVWRFRDDVPARMEMFQSYDEALAAVTAS